MRSFLIMSLGISVTLSHALAQGCGPTRLKVTESVSLDMPAVQAWAIVGSFQDMSWDKLTAASRGSGGNDPDRAVRTITLKDGAVFGESLFKYDAEAMSYSYHVDKIDVRRLPVQNLSVTLEVKPASNLSKSVVKWRAVFYRYLRPDEPAPDVADAQASEAVSTYMRAGLEGLRKSDSRT